MRRLILGFVLRCFVSKALIFGNQPLNNTTVRKKIRALLAYKARKDSESVALPFWIQKQMIETGRRTVQMEGDTYIERLSFDISFPIDIK